MTIQLNVRVPAETGKRLDKLVKATGRSKTFLTVAALNAFLAEQAWQLEEIAGRIQEAKQGKFASEKKVDTFFAKYDC